MRYSVEHKERSREKILEAARELFRLRGFDGASIDQVMHAAGLTRGAFYAHFESKDDLVRHVLAIEAGLVDKLRRAAAGQPRDAAFAALRDYLDPAERLNNSTGCPLLAHPVDAIRAGGDRKDGYTQRLAALVDSVEEVLGADSHDDAIVVSVLTLGAGLLSAASADPNLADHIEQVCLTKIRDIIDDHRVV